MKGGHDLGGRQGLGPINPELEAEEPVFHTDWERRVFAMTLATGMLGQWNIDESRFARESQHPADYLDLHPPLDHHLHRHLQTDACSSISSC